ncbi:hypothetical protein M430DRAFT_37110 [Amorphotheca resinae ATCC 22711]|uniref:VOC domain-containing protein n=1 Tax=Amorphotheca resinae ATCC 22711 TaxID=857342 RepID=A0A2T3ARI7_AMORE|nr:hypothetical protein M430DRAFT_37110 [Amorphotheca resinae ATCC 22711]PSS08966.1 hypothetical protein M430DRAFT_37110 [Amorphotheca resinae ATCC 22711]
MSSDGHPVIEVSHLPSAASFYAEITQPLGISYLSALPDRLNFGWVSKPVDDKPPQPHVVFSLRQSPASSAHRCLITLVANSAGAVESFYNKSVLCNEANKDHTLVHSGEESKARTRDLDGNMLEAVYSARAPHALPRRRTMEIETASTPKQAQRVLSWQHEVARSVAASGAEPSPSPAGEFGAEMVTVRDRDGEREPIRYRRVDTYPAESQFDTGRAPRLIRRETVQTDHYHIPGDEERSSGGGGGLTGMKLVGTLLGAAAGAAVAYAMVRSESPPRQSGPPRRASYGDHPVPTHSQVYYEQQAVPPSRVMERIPARSSISVEPREPQYLAQYTIAGPPPSRVNDLARIEERSHVSYRSGRSEQKSTRERSRSAHGSRHESRALTILPAQSESPHAASHAASHVSRQSQKTHRSDERRSSHHGNQDGDRQSYVSTRSHRTEKVDAKYDGGSGSGTSTTTITVVPAARDDRKSVISARNIPLPPSVVSARNIPLPQSAAQSVVSARNIPLPESVVSGSRYAASVAPSDSVSSVGSKRERERLRERMSQRW